jgi:formamidopyrimidine-DNA glycosylase
VRPVPELVEVESYRRLAERALHRPIASVEAADAWYLKGGTTAAALTAALVGEEFVGARRIGKLLVLDAQGVSLGLRFGMSGRLMVDGAVSIEELVYSSSRPDPAFERFGLTFADGGSLVLIDPRRLGGVELEPDETRLGPDAAAVGLAALRDALASSRVALKARLMDQRRLAGIGNLTADELLWRASLSPLREAGSLTATELRRLHRHLRAVLTDLDEHGGSHTGTLMEHRRPGGVCPRDGEPLRRDAVGGRSTWWCPRHQR